MENGKEHWEDGDYVCVHCHLIYAAHGSKLRCDLCNRKLQWRTREQIKALEVEWDKKGNVLCA